MSWFSKLRDGLGRAREALLPLQKLSQPQRPLDEAFWDELEETLISADFGVSTTEKILKNLRIVSVQELWRFGDQVMARFRKDVGAFMTLPNATLSLKNTPSVMIFVGVNGTGKTTSIGKLAARLRSQRLRVMVVAADTFRAAAAEQLAVWSERSGAEFIRGREGADPSSVVFDGITAAKSRGVDVVLIDTAGRLQNKVNLMEELKKMRRIVERELGRPPDETLLVIDATTGQNAVSQAKLFNETAELSGIILTKLDSSAKGGVVVAVIDTVEVPIKFIGLGESVDALQPFVAAEFISALFDPVDAPAA